jgi:hypothetical protein
MSLGKKSEKMRKDEGTVSLRGVDSVSFATWDKICSELMNDLPSADITEIGGLLGELIPIFASSPLITSIQCFVPRLPESMIRAACTPPKQPNPGNPTNSFRFSPQTRSQPLWPPSSSKLHDYGRSHTTISIKTVHIQSRKTGDNLICQNSSKVGAGLPTTDKRIPERGVSISAVAMMTLQETALNVSSGT